MRNIFLPIKSFYRKSQLNGGQKIQMPIHCKLSIPALSRETFGELDFRVMKHAFAAQNLIGHLADEVIYKNNFRHRLLEAGFDAFCEVPIELSFENFRKIYRIDTALIEGGVYELKTVTDILPKHEAQLRNYLMMLDLQHGKVINFRTESVTSRFVNVTDKTCHRRSFTVNDDNWAGSRQLRELVLAMLADWGVGLHLSLYQEALAYLLSSDQHQSIDSLDLSHDHTLLGKQSFILATPDQAIKITCFVNPDHNYPTNLKKLMCLTRLRQIHWINLTRGEVCFRTIGRTGDSFSGKKI